MAGSQRLRSDQLQAQALGDVARENARGLEPLQPGQHRLDPLRRAAQALGDLAELKAQVAAFVDAVDQDLGDGAVGAGETGERELVRSDAPPA